MNPKPTPSLNRQIGIQRRALRKQKRSLSGAAYERVWIALRMLTHLGTAPVQEHAWGEGITTVDAAALRARTALAD